LPAATSLFTSLYPYTHGISKRSTDNLLAPDIKTLPEILKKNGFRTAAFTGGLDYYRGFGHMRGFQITDDNPNFTGFNVTLKQAEEWLAKKPPGRFFLFIHGYDAHCPFTPPKEFKGRFSGSSGKKAAIDYTKCVRAVRTSTKTYDAFYMGGCTPFRTSSNCPPVKPVVLTQDDINYLKDLYDEEVLSVDCRIGKFLGSLDGNILQKTLIIILSEHGEMFAKHGRFGRPGTLRGAFYDDVVHVPLLIRLPETAGRRLHGLVELTDIMPTVLEFLQIHPHQKMQGRSLMPLMVNGRKIHDYVHTGLAFNLAAPPQKARTKTFSERILGMFKAHDFPSPRMWTRSYTEVIRSLDWKLLREVDFPDFDKDTSTRTVRKETFELYNMRTDPDEFVDMTDAHPDVAQKLKIKLDEWVRKSKNFVPYYPSTKKIPDSLLKDAKEHGYWQ
ncbi:MAG: sulfatase-like hydrolase/transferase, partial [bacterium]